MTDKKNVRKSVVLSPELAEVLEQLARDTGTTKTALIKGGIALMKMAHEEKRKGRHLGFTKESEQLDTEIVGVF